MECWKTITLRWLCLIHSLPHPFIHSFIPTFIHLPVFCASPQLFTQWSQRDRQQGTEWSAHSCHAFPRLMNHLSCKKKKLRSNLHSCHRVCCALMQESLQGEVLPWLGHERQLQSRSEGESIHLLDIYSSTQLVFCSKFKGTCAHGVDSVVFVLNNFQPCPNVGLQLWHAWWLTFLKWSNEVQVWQLLGLWMRFIVAVGMLACLLV